MDRIRLIASDMDATLLDGHSQLPPDFLHLVKEPDYFVEFTADISSRLLNFQK